MNYFFFRPSNTLDVRVIDKELGLDTYDTALEGFYRITPVINLSHLPISSSFHLFLKLPSDVIFSIFSYLDPYSLCICTRVCREWYCFSIHDCLWNTHWQRANFSEPTSIELNEQWEQSDRLSWCHLYLNRLNHLKTKSENSILMMCPRCHQKSCEIRVYRRGINEVRHYICRLPQCSFRKYTKHGIMTKYEYYSETNEEVLIPDLPDINTSEYG